MCYGRTEEGHQILMWANSVPEFSVILCMTPQCSLTSCDCLPSNFSEETMRLNEFEKFAQGDMVIRG